MLTKTTISAIRVLLHLHLRGGLDPVSPREVALRLGESPTYLAKVARQFVKAGILRALRGVAGGVVVNRSPRDTTLLSIVEACQGAILGSFCQDTDDLRQACAFHRAAAELHEATVGVLSRWTLADLLRAPCPTRNQAGRAPCWMEPLGIPEKRSSASPGPLRKGRHVAASRRLGP